MTYSVPYTTAVVHNWSFPAGWLQTGGGTTNSVTVTVGTGSGNISATPSNGCGSGTPRTLAVSSYLLPSNPGAISGNVGICQGSAQTYSVANVSGVTYTWSFPPGWTQTGGGTSNSVTVTAGSVSGNVQVIPSSPCSSGPASVLPVIVYPLPAPIFSGSQSACAGSTGNVYSVQSGFSFYFWTVSPGGSITAGGSPTNNSVTITWNTAGPQYVSVMCI